MTVFISHKTTNTSFIIKQYDKLAKHIALNILHNMTV